MAATETYRLQITRAFAAPREKVFKAWTDPEALKAFHAPSPEFAVPNVEVDLRVGGRFRIEMKAPDGNSHVAVGTYREIAPPEKLVYTWSWEKGGRMDDVHSDLPETLVTLEFRAKGSGTELTLTHEKFVKGEQRDSHQQGWTGILGRLEGFLA